MKTISQYLREQGIDEAAEIRKLKAARTRAARHPGLRFYPGQPRTRTQYDVAPGHAPGVEPPIDCYSPREAQIDLLRIAAAPNQTAEYVALYCLRNHLKP